MKKLTWIVSLLFINISILGALQIFSFNLNFYKNHFSFAETIESKMPYVENVYGFLQDKNLISTDFTRSESEHMNDVKIIFSIVHIVFRISLFLFLGIGIYLIFMSESFVFLNWLLFWSLVSLLLMLLLIIFIVLDFGSAFIFFHELLFPQWNRSFPLNSLLIQLFPESFFVSISRYVFLSISGFSAFVMFTSILLKKILK